MNSLNIIQLLTFLTINFIFIYRFEYLSRFFNLFDYPNKIRKKQHEPISLLGGFIFFINFFIFLFFDIFFEQDTFKLIFKINSNIQLFTFIIVFCAIYLVGYADDKFDLRPFSKVVIVTFCLYLIIYYNPHFLINSLRSELLHKEVDLFYIGPYFTILCLLCFINAMNMFDGINLVSFFQFLLINLIFLIESNIFEFNLILIFSLLVFGYLNFKNKTFLGDSGVYILSLVSGILLIILYKSNQLNVEDIIILIYLPILDFIRLFFTRIYNGNSPFLPDEKHFHHFLVKKNSFNKTILIIFLMIYLPPILTYIFNISYLILLLFIIIYFVLIKTFKNN